MLAAIPVQKKSIIVCGSNLVISGNLVLAALLFMALFIISTRSLISIGLATYSSAPENNAFFFASLELTAVRIIIIGCFFKSTLIFFVSSMPSISGISQSVTTISISLFLKISKASLPFSTSKTLKPFLTKSFLKANREEKLSSTISRFCESIFNRIFINKYMKVRRQFLKYFFEFKKPFLRFYDFLSFHK